MRGRQIIQIATVFGALGVAIGAFGAHGLQETLEQTGRRETFETAVKYQFYHALALFLVGIMALMKPKFQGYTFAVICFTAGIFVFSGSLYILSLSGITWLGAIAPIGGVCFIAGWLRIFWTVTRN